MLIKKLKRFGHLETIDSGSFTCLNLDSNCQKKYPKRDFLQIAAFDPGIVNTGCRIEKRNKNKVETISQVLIKGGGESKETHYYFRVAEKLYSLAEDLYQCDYILVESQLTTNPEACRMGQHLISTIMGIVRGGRPLIIEISPTVKSRAFGVYGIKGRDLKKWATEHSLHLLESRNDQVGLSLIKASKKKDDHGDVVLYCEAWAKILRDEKK